MRRSLLRDHLPSPINPLLLLVLWLHFFWCLIPSWQDGDYYRYGWLVAPLAIGFAYRRWQAIKEATQSTVDSFDTQCPSRRVLQVGLLSAYLLFIIPTRMIEIADPNWRIPILIHAFLLVCLSHLSLGWSFSWRHSLVLLPVTVFALSSVPYPWQIEQWLVRWLTGGVAWLTQEAFLLRGVPVERFGETLHCGGEAVEVGDACSGIKSLQSLIMAALFFGELLWLPWTRRCFLIVAAGLCALIVNAGRAYYLASVQFQDGEAAASAVHDLAGHLAYATSAIFLFAVAKLLTLQKRTRKVVRRRIGEPGHPAH